jgi:hypothetical protein
VEGLIAAGERPRTRAATVWSLDARLMVRPGSTFRSIATHAASASDDRRVWTACRRPMFLTLVLASIVSLLASGTLTLRLAASASVYWASIPIVEALALAIVIGRRSNRLSMSRVLDLFFAGHGAWTLLLLAIATSLVFLPPDAGWTLLLRLWVWVMLAVIAWSAYVDACFFRSIFGSSRRTALRDLVVLRLLTWTAVVAIFAAPSMTSAGLIDTVSTILRGR